MTTSLMLALLGSVSGLFVGTTDLYAAPVGGDIVAGSGAITGQGTNTVNITQSGQRLVIDWQSFNTNTNESVNFSQPNSNAWVLNRITNGSPTNFQGKLNANGNVLVINPNGVMFGSGSKIDVNGLVVSTANITNTNFMNDTQLKFDQPGNPNAVIVNNGQISAKEAGLIGFVAPQVQNNGIIQANLGTVHLASGDHFTLDLYGDGLIEIAASDAVNTQLVKNTGLIKASGGTIALTAASAKNAVDNVINVGGSLEATSVAEKNGKIIIWAAGNSAVANNISADKGKAVTTSTVLVQAKLDVSGRKAGERGGKILITGDHVALLDGTVIDASGYEGLSGTTNGLAVSAPRIGSAGGEILIGGDYLGQGNTPTARNLYVGSGVLVLNDSLYQGDAGRTIFWSDNSTSFYGNVYARALGGKPIDITTRHATAGGNSGNGGFVETSGHNYLDVGGYVDLTASNGQRGTYFLDPTNITIYGGLTLDALSTASSIAYGLNKLSSGYSGPAIRVRRSSDNAEQDIGFTSNGTLDTAALLNFVTSNGSNPTASGYVAVWYDQSGNGRNAGQTSAGNQPRIVNSGSVETQNGTATVHFVNASQTYLSNVGSGYSLNDLNIVFGYQSTHQYQNVVSSCFPSIAGCVKISWADTGNNLSNHAANTNFVYQNGISQNTSNFNDYLVGVGVNAGLNQWSINSTQTTNDGQITLGTDSYDPAGRSFDGYISEVLNFNTALSATDRILVLQHQALEHGITLTPPGTGATEADKAMASDGYSVFTTRYLEHLSQSADISLQASNNIVLDLKNDTLNLATNRNLTLTAVSGSITSVSAGTLQTNGTGTITLNAGAGIDLSTYAVSLNTNGIVTATSVGHMKLGPITSTGLTATATGSGSKITTSSVAVGTGGNITLTADDVDIAGSLSGTGTLTLQPYDPARQVRVNSGTDDGSIFHLKTAELNNLTNNWGNIFVGRTNGSNTMLLYNSAWIDPITFRNSGTIYIDGTVVGTGNTSFAFAANTVFRDGSITTSNQAVNFNANLSFEQGGTVTTSGGAVTVGGIFSMRANNLNAATITTSNGTIALNGILTQGVNTAGKTLTLNAGNGTVSFANTVDGAYNLSVTADTITTSGAWGGTTPLGTVTLTSLNNLTLPAIRATSVLARATGSSAGITTSAQITTTGTGNALVLAGHSFTNSAGSTALNATGSGRFLVWSDDPGADSRGGIAYDFKQYNASYGVTTVAGAGDGFLYTLAPTITVGVTGIVTRAYNGTDAAVLGSGNFTTSAATDGDTLSVGYTSAIYNNKNIGNTKNVAVSGITLTANNGAAAVYGYQVNATANANVGEITQAALTITANNLNKTIGNTLVFAGTEFIQSGLFSGDAISNVVFASAGAASGAALGPYAINASSASGTGLGNYTISYIDGTLSVIDAPVTPPVDTAANEEVLINYKKVFMPELGNENQDIIDPLNELISFNENENGNSVKNPYTCLYRFTGFSTGEVENAQQCSN